MAYSSLSLEFTDGAALGRSLHPAFPSCSSMQNDPLLAWVHVQSGRQGSGSSLGLSDAGSGGSGVLAGAGGGSSDGSLPLGTRVAGGPSGSGLGAELQRWHLQYSDLVIQRPLGEGSFGKVGGVVLRRMQIRLNHYTN